MSQAKTSPTVLILSLRSVLYKPCRPYFAKILLGSLLTVGCISSWMLAGRQDKRYKKIYSFIARIGRQVDKIQDRLLHWLLESSRLFPIESPIELVIDDTPIKRYGRKVEGAGRMHDPTNPHCRNATCYGHSLVMIGMIVRRPLFGSICLSVGWKFYVNENKLATIDEKIRPQFKTKHEIAAELLERIVPVIRKTGRKVEILFDRGYLAEGLFQTIHELKGLLSHDSRRTTTCTRFPKSPPFRVAVVPENMAVPSNIWIWSPETKVECNELRSNVMGEKIGQSFVHASPQVK